MQSLHLHNQHANCFQKCDPTCRGMHDLKMNEQKGQASNQ